MKIVVTLEYQTNAEDVDQDILWVVDDLGSRPDGRVPLTCVRSAVVE